MRRTGASLLVTACAGVAIAQDCDVVYEAPGEQAGGAVAQLYEAGFEHYDTWLGDDFSTDTALTEISLSAVGFCGTGCIDPFLVADFIGQFRDGVPSDPESQVVLESVSFGFNGVDTWSALFGAPCLPAGDYVFFFAARNDFLINGTIFFHGLAHESSDGVIWLSGQGDLVEPFEAGVPLAPQVSISACACDASCPADCDENGALNVLDFVCFQQLFQSGDASADCDGSGTLDVLDFVCFQQAFGVGCG